MALSRRERAVEIAKLIAESQAKGEVDEANKLIAVFNELLSEPSEENAPKSDPKSQVSPQAQVEIPSQDVEQVIEHARAELVSGIRSESKALENYPEALRPMLQNLLEEASVTAQVPRVVLEPQFFEELDALIAQKLEEEPLLQKLPHDSQIRSILTRYKEEFLEILKERNA
jgi:hypothetical protein